MSHLLQIFGLQFHMPRRRRYAARLPRLHVWPQFKLNQPPLHHNVLMFEPVLRPRLSVDLDTLNVIALVETLCGDSQRLVPVDRHVEVWEPWGRNKVHRLSNNRVDSEHLPEEPCVHCPCIAVAWDSVRSIFETIGSSQSIRSGFRNYGTYY